MYNCARARLWQTAHLGRIAICDHERSFGDGRLQEGFADDLITDQNAPDLTDMDQRQRGERELQGRVERDQNKGDAIVVANINCQDFIWGHLHPVGAEFDGQDGRVIGQGRGGQQDQRPCQMPDQ